MPEQGKLVQRYRMARSNLLLMTILSLINIILIAVHAELSFPFSAFSPQLIYTWGTLEAESLGSAFLHGMVYVSIALIFLLFLLCYFLSKKHDGWMIAAFILFLADSLLMAYCYIKLIEPEFIASAAIDVVFHLWVLGSMLWGIIARRQLKRICPEDADALMQAVPKIVLSTEPSADAANPSDNFSESPQAANKDMPKPETDPIEIDVPGAQPEMHADDSRADGTDSPAE